MSLALPGSGLSQCFYCLIKCTGQGQLRNVCCGSTVGEAHCPPFPVTLKALIMNRFIPAWKNMCDVLLN